jgi:RHS repeat-associated protein
MWARSASLSDNVHPHADLDQNAVLEERLYYCQSWRADVVAVVDSTGTLVEGARYSAYGVPIGVPAGDTNTDLAFDSTDSTNITGWSPPASYDVRYDVNLDGAITSADASAAATVTLGRGVLSSAAVDNRRGYAAYEFWPQPASNLYSVRHRVLHSDLGRWTRRDPQGYGDGPSLYAYSRSRAYTLVDPAGLVGLTPPGLPKLVKGPCGNSKAWEAVDCVPDSPDLPDAGNGDLGSNSQPYCDLKVANCLKKDIYIDLLLELIEQACPRGWMPTFSCGNCDNPNNGAEFKCEDREISICDPKWTEDQICMMLRHELQHVLDTCNIGCGNMTCADIACTEVRAANTSGQCCIDAVNGGWKQPGETYQQCVRRLAETSSAAHCSNPKRAVSAVWDGCYEPCASPCPDMAGCPNFGPSVPFI